MRGRIFVATVATLCAAATACSGGSGKSSPKAAGKSQETSTTAKPKPTATLPPNVPRSEQFCALTSSLAEKFKSVQKPSSPEESAPLIRELANFFQEASPVAPAALAPDVQKLNQFYGNLATRLESGTSGSAVPLSLGDLADSANRLRQYFSGVCGVDDSVFNL